MKRKFKLSYSYIKCGKRYEEELTFDKFYKTFSECISEYCFYFEEYTIYLAYHFDNTKQINIYELNIESNFDETQNYEFDNAKDLLEAKVINGCSLKQIWKNITN